MPGENKAGLHWPPPFSPGVGSPGAASTAQRQVTGAKPGQPVAPTTLRPPTSFIVSAAGTGATRISAHSAVRSLGAVEVMQLKNGDSEIRNLNVSPEFRGKGIGSDLVRNAVAVASRSGAARIVLEARPSTQSIPASNLVQMYAKLGFCVTANGGRRGMTMQRITGPVQRKERPSPGPWTAGNVRTAQLRSVAPAPFRSRAIQRANEDDFLFAFGDDLVGGTERPSVEQVNQALSSYSQIDPSGLGRLKLLSFDLEEQAVKKREGECAQEMERQVGGLGRNPGGGIMGDFIGLGGTYKGKTIDHLGQPKTNGENVASFYHAIDKHYAKQGVDYVLIDIKYFSAKDRFLIVKYLNKNYAGKSTMTLVWTGVRLYKSIPPEKDFVSGI